MRVLISYAVFCLQKSYHPSYSRLKNLKDNQELNNLSFVIKPILDGTLAAAVIGRQAAESVNALQGANGGGIERRHATGLLDLDVKRMTVASNVEGNVDALGGGDLGIHLVLQPILRHFALNDLDVPAIPRAKIAAAPGYSE